MSSLKTNAYQDTPGFRDQAEHRATATSCKFCRDPIHRGARICKSCKSLQGFLARCASGLPSFLTSIVALASLGIAYTEHQNAKDARILERSATSAYHAKSGELVAQTHAAERALEDVLTAVSKRGTDFRTELAVPSLEVEALERRVQSNPTDVRSRRDLFMRKAVIDASSRLDLRPR